MAMSLNRSSFLPELNSPKDKTLPEIPLVVFSTTNPYGVGHNWVKAKFINKGREGEVISIKREVFNPRTQKRETTKKTQAFIFGTYKENRYLSPEYVLELEEITDENQRKAWLDGNWDITSGGMFDDVWSTDVNVVKAFNIPSSWHMFRSFDWGSSKPFSVGWWARSDGTDYFDEKGEQISTVRGDLFRIFEWYGWNGRPNEGIKMIARKISEGIVAREINSGYRDRIKAGVADNSIENDTGIGSSIAEEMAKPVNINGNKHQGVRWTKSDKSAGSRATGWELMRSAIFNAKKSDDGSREYAGLFVFDNCVDGFIRTVPSLAKSLKNFDDIDTDTEDHTADEVRYVILDNRDMFQSGKTTGYF